MAGIIGGGLLPPLVAELVMDIDKYSAGALKAQATTTSLADTTNAMFNKVGKATTEAFLGITVASIGMAADFDAQMTRLYTAAGAPKDAVKAATDQVLQMGDAVGFSGTQIAEALYHPVSAGLDLSTSLQAVKYSAEEAQISGASLDDTTYALSSVMKAFNIDASGAHDTMALLNSIVGQGDMRFQDFNTSVKNWAPTAAQMGISIQSMGAALAYLTDRGNSAEEAATRVTMGLTMMATPSKQAGKLLEGLGVASSDVTASTQAMTEVLHKTGITQNQLAQDLAKPDGIYVALTHLKDALAQAGIKGTEADSVLSKIFGGGRSDKAILSLMQNLDGLKTKFDDIGNGVTKFDQNWTDTQATFSFKLKQLRADTENLAIAYGEKLIPGIEAVVGWFDKNKWAVDVLAGATAAVLTVSVVKYAQTLTTTVITAIGKTIAGMQLLGNAGEESAAKVEAASAAATKWGAALGSAIPVIGAVVAGATMLGHKMDDWFGGVQGGVGSADQFTVAMLKMNAGVQDLGFGTDAGFASMVRFGQSMDDTAEPIAAVGIALAKAGQKIGDGNVLVAKYDAGLAQLVQSGHADRAKQIMDQITAATDGQGHALINTQKDFVQYFAAVDAAKASAAENASATTGATAAVDENAIAMDENAKMSQQAVDADTALSNALDAVTASYSALSGNLSASDALLNLKKDLLDVKDQVEKTGKAFDMNSQAGIANMQAFDKGADAILKYRDAEIKNGVSTDQANKDAADQAKQLLAVWEQVTGNKQAVDDYAKSIGLIPTDMTTNVSTPGMAGALSQAQHLADIMDRLDGSTTSVSAPSPRMGHSRAAGMAEGGRVVGPGTSTSDSVPIYASVDEWIVPAAAANAAGYGTLAAINAGDLGAAAAMLGAAPAAAAPASAGYGGYGAPATPVVNIWLDSAPVNGAVRRSTLRYDLRNSGNNLALAGHGQQ